MAVTPFVIDARRDGGVRREPRVDALRIVEYARFPRVGAEARPRVGFTRDFSATGMCVGADDASPVGALLRVTVRELDGLPARTTIERVVWCEAQRDGRYWVGLERLSEATAPAEIR